MVSRTPTRLRSASCLTYYDVSAPVILQVDASDYGLGVALPQPSKHHESCLQPMAHSSKSLTSTEQRYAQIKKECLAIVKTFNKFDQWLLGKSDITVLADHQPLQSIFQKDLASAPKRVQKMMLFLQRYNFRVACRKGSSLHLADTLSRAPCREEATTPSMPGTFQVFHMHLTQLDPTLPSLTDDTRQWLPHVKRCSHWRTISSMAGLPLKTIYLNHFKHIGTSEKSSVSRTASFEKPLEPLSLHRYARPC